MLRLVIVLDNEIISAPNINEPITTGNGMISGNFTFQEATDLALLLRSGALPTLIVVEERTVGPDHTLINPNYIFISWFYLSYFICKYINIKSLVLLLTQL